MYGTPVIIGYWVSNRCYGGLLNGYIYEMIAGNSFHWYSPRKTACSLEDY